MSMVEIILRNKSQQNATREIGAKTPNLVQSCLPPCQKCHHFSDFLFTGGMISESEPTACFLYAKSSQKQKFLIRGLARSAVYGLLSELHLTAGHPSKSIDTTSALHIDPNEPWQPKFKRQPCALKAMLLAPSKSIPHASGELR